MKIYRNHYIFEGESKGYAFFSSKKKAESAYRLFCKEHGLDFDTVWASDDERVYPIDIDPTKESVLRALNRFASHADNG